jgi:hypothetical protein
LHTPTCASPKPRVNQFCLAAPVPCPPT